MKKIILCLMTVTMAVGMIFGLASCGGNEIDEPETGLQKYVSNVYESLLTGADDNFSVSLYSGRQEKLFVADGAAGELQPFVTLKVVPKSTDLLNNTYTYTITGDKGTLEGDLVKGLFGASFSADISSLDTVGTPQSVTLTHGELTYTVTLADVLADKLTWKQALAIAEENFANKIATENQTGNFAREIYVKIINDTSEPSSPYYWYVAFISSPADYWAILIDPVSGDVISKKS